MTRLTELERRERETREEPFMRSVVDLAAILGWDWLHVRPGMRANGRWHTATVGTLAAWPDLVLVRVRDHRLILAELKRELEHPTDSQAEVLERLRALECHLEPSAGATRVEVHVWRPSDLRDPIDESTIGRILR